MASNKAKTPVRVAWGAVLLSMALGVTLWSAQSGAQMPEELMLRPRLALKTAHDLYKQRDYENADRFYRQAQAGQAELSATERQDLAKLMQQNAVALQARREGGTLLMQAQQALSQGKVADANARLKAANANQYLTNADRQLLMTLNDRVREMGGSAGSNPRPGTTAVETGIVVKGTDAKAYLTAARQALEKGHLELAENFVKNAESTGSSFSWMPWGDSPAKVRRDIQAAHAKQQAAPVVQTTEKKESPGAMSKVSKLLTPPWMRDKDKDTPAAPDSAVKPPSFPAAPPREPSTAKKTSVPPMEPAAPKKGPTSLVQDLGPTVVPPLEPRGNPAQAKAQARKLIDDGYRALQANDLATARRCADQAKALRPDLDWNERNPERLLADIDRKASGTTLGGGTAADARNWVKQGRAQFQVDKLDDAETLCAKAGAVSGVRWGLFEDTPDKLRADILEARTRLNRDKARQLMVEARKLHGQGNIAAAKAKAWEAQQLHGPYSVWDFGDRPQKLLDEIARAESGNPKTPVLPRDNVPPPPDQVAQNPPAPPAPLVPPTTPRTPVNLVSASNQGPNRLKATQLIAEARDLEKRGLLIEARHKAVEADALGVQFGVDEDSPRSILLSLASRTDQRIQQLLEQATDFVQNNPNDPTRFQKAEVHITNARKLAQAFGLDQKLIEQRVQWLQNVAAGAGVVSPISAPSDGGPLSNLANADVKAAASPEMLRSRQIGMERIDKARFEIKAGNYTLARRLAEEAFNPAYGVQEEAAQLLRTIDSQEFLHLQNVANMNYNSGMDAFLRKDFRRAAQLWETIDVRLLPPDKQRQLAELMQDARGGVIPAKFELASSAKPGVAATDPPGTQGALDKYSAMEEIQAQQLRERSLNAMNHAMKLAQDKKLPEAVDTLKEFLDQLKNANVSPERVAGIRRQVESKMQQYSTLAARLQLDTEARNAQPGNKENVRNQKIAQLQKDVGELLNSARAKYKEGQFKDALALAKQAKALDGDNVAVDALLVQTTIAMNDLRHKEIEAEKQEMFLRAQDGNPGPYVDMENPLALNRSALERAQRRKTESIQWQSKDPVERMIERKLDTPQSFHWKDQALSQIMEDIRTIMGINVVPDVQALKEQNINLDMPMSLTVENVKLKSALNILLSNAKLTYVIKDQVLKITTEAHAKGKLKQIVHPVADLIVPVENHGTSEVNSFQSALMRHIHKNPIDYGAGTPYSPPFSLPQNNSGLPPQHYGNSTVPPAGPSPAATGFMQNPNTKLQPGETMERLLMDLIKNTVAQNTWNDQGGPGAIQYYPLGMAMVVNQTLEVQEEVAALLQSLRRLQDLEVAIEMRLVSVSEAFFERMGLDFDINIRTPHSRHEQQLLSGQFTPFGSVNRNLGVRDVLSGLTPAGTLTPDLNIPLRASSYDFTIPPFGGFPGTFGSNGGLSLGLAFLNDIQVFMFLEAAAGDRRTNVMQAPKITLFNGQVATMSIQDFQFFLTDVQVAVPNNGSNIFFVPNQQPFPLGVNLTVSAVVSADRRFVRVNLVPTIANLASATVPLFPVSVVVPQFFQGPGNNSSTNTQPQIFTTFYQQPTFTQININTTVNVPDGGTVLLGGLKTLSEARNEFGPPLLSKIPYLNRLFRNIGYGRESQSLMIMVTPRIIINEEEEQILLGQIPPIPRP